MPRYYRSITALMAAALLLCLFAAVWAWRLSSASDLAQQSNQLDKQVARELELAALLVEQEAAHLRVVAEAIAQSGDFNGPPDESLDDLRNRDISSKRAFTLATREGIETWLTDSQDTAPLQAVLSSHVTLKQIFRGLPLRASTGQVLAQSRRALAAAALSASHDLAAIAEIDENGQTIFLAPYRLQVASRQFDLSKALQLQTTHDPRNRSWFEVADIVGIPDAEPRLTVVAPIRRQVNPRFVVVQSAAFDDSSANPSNLAFVLLSRTGQVLMRVGDVTRAQLPHASTRSLLIGSTPYVVALDPVQPVHPRFPWRGGVILAVSVLAPLVALNALVWHLLSSDERKRRQLVDAAKKVEEDTSSLAHDYGNRMTALDSFVRNATPLLKAADVDLLRGVIEQLRKYTGQLPSLATPIFQLLGLTVQSERRPQPTYVRGVVETLAHQQAAHVTVVAPTADELKLRNDTEPFAVISSVDLERILSNVLVNATEACQNKEDKRIVVSIAADAHTVEVTITDNGNGMAPHSFEDVFTRGFSTKGGRRRGDGLSVCRELARKNNGSIRVLESTLGAGTKIGLVLPRAATPRWFCNEVPLHTGDVIVIVDDDAAEVSGWWEKAIAARTLGMRVDGLLPRVVALSSPEALRQNFENALNEGTTFLIDHEFRESRTSGVDLIRELRLEQKAILVTRHSERPEVQEAASALGIRLIPKSYMLNTKFPILFREVNV
jgi:signal transduction histidine kinase